MVASKKKANDKKKISGLFEDLALLESYAQELFSFSPLPICYVSPNGVILEANPAFEKISGYNIYEIIGEPIENFFAKEKIRELTKETINKGFVKTKEISVFTKEKRKIAVSVFTALRKSKKGEIIGYFVGFFDLSDIKKKEKELQEKIEELEKFHKIAVDRELKMVALKEEIEKLKKELEKPKGRK
jgi:PAS domain S-box-containing protein